MYLFLDLEMNTWKNVSGGLCSEVIEIGAVLMDSDQKILNTFSELVRPTHKKRLSPYCLKLTGISKGKLENALPLEVILVQMCEWANGYQKIEGIYSWNESDYRQIIKECEVKGIKTPLIDALERSYIDYQQVFGQKFDWQTCGLADALDLFNIKQSDKAHRALNDAMDVARLYKKMNKLQKDPKRTNYIKEQAQLKKIEKLNPVVRNIKEMSLGKQVSNELESKIKEMVANEFYTDLNRVYKKYNARDIIAALPELKGWLMVLEGIMIELKDDNATKETAASSLREVATGR